MRQLNWHAWHRRYEQIGSSISRRLEVVQRLLRSELDRRTSGEIVVLSICAGQAHDLLGVLTEHPRAVDVTARLVEYDAANCGQLEDRLSATGLSGIEVLCTDAGHPSAYEGWPPADIVLVCGCSATSMTPTSSARSPSSQWCAQKVLS